MKKLLLLLIIPLLSFGQEVITLQLNQNIRLTPTTGFNGSTIRGPSWINSIFNDSVKTMCPKLLRYPGGNVANYWNWNEGWFYPQSVLDTVLTDTIYALPNAWNNLESIDIRPIRFKEALDQIDSEGIFTLNMMSSSLSNQLVELQNAIDSGLVIDRVELGSEFNHGNPFSEIKFPTAGDYARESNTWIDSVKTLIPNVEIGVVAGNRGPDYSRAWRWNDSICSIVTDADALIWHLYIYLNDDDTIFSNKQVVAYPFYRVPLYEQWRGFQDTTSLIQDYNIWVTEYNLFDKTTDKIFANTWAHVLILAGMNQKLLENNLIEIMIQHNISGILPNFDALDVENNFRKRSSGFSGLIWNKQMLGMDTAQKIDVTSNVIDSVDYQNDNGITNQVFFSKIFGWKFANSEEERAILINISSDTITVNASSILPSNSNWVSWTSDSLFAKIDSITHIQMDTILNAVNISLPPYSINVANSFCYNDIDNDGICDHLEVDGCSQDLEACNYNLEGTQDCVYPIDLYGISYVDCNGVCINDGDFFMNNPNGDGVCDEVDNCPDVYNPNQEDFNADGVGDACDGIGLDEDAIQRKLIKVVDVLGREIDKENKDALLLYIYDDGSVEKKYVIE